MSTDIPQQLAQLRAQQERLREQIRKLDEKDAVLGVMLGQDRAELLAVERTKKIIVGLRDLAEASIAALKAGGSDLPSIMHAFEEAATDAKRFYLLSEDVDEMVTLTRAAFVEAAKKGGVQA